MTPRFRRPLLAAVALALTGVAVPTATAAPTDVTTAPGRVVFATDGGVVHDNVDAGGGGFPVLLPGGSVLIVGGTADPGSTPRIAITKLTSTGAIDSSWGSGGVLETPVRLNLLQVLRQADGEMLLVGTDQIGGAPGAGPPPLKVVRLRADGAVDTGFAQGGTATAPVGIGCGACTTAALAPGGAIVLVGATGSYPTNPSPTTVPDLHWSVVRLTAAGAVDASFGTSGVATIPGVRASGFNVAVLPGGGIVTEGQTAGSGFSNDGVSVILARLTPSGAMDPAFGGGAPVRTPIYSGFPFLVRSDGSIVIAGSEPGLTQPPFTPGRRLVAAYTPSGALDESFGTRGVADIGPFDVQHLEPAKDAGIAVVATPWQTLVPGTGTPAGQFAIGRWPASGPPATPFAIVRVPFGGGGSSFLVSVRPRPLPPLGQNSFSGRTLIPRPDGSFLAIGGVHVSQPTGEGVGYSIGRTAVAAITPSLALDPAFGGPAAPLRASISVPRQRARTAYERHGIRVRVRASAPGLWRVKIRLGDGRVLAQSVLPIFAAGARTLPVELTRTGNLWLRRHHPVRVTVATTARDLFGTQTTTTATGRLR
jgi:uncharacterized delta-60 repeat protein